MKMHATAALAADPSAMPDLGCYENQDKIRGGVISFR